MEFTDREPQMPLRHFRESLDFRSPVSWIFRPGTAFRIFMWRYRELQSQGESGHISETQEGDYPPV